MCSSDLTEFVMKRSGSDERVHVLRKLGMLELGLPVVRPSGRLGVDADRVVTV